MTEETPQQAARYTSFGHDFQKLVAASSGVSNPVFEMNGDLDHIFRLHTESKRYELIY